MTDPISARLRNAQADDCCNDLKCDEAADHIDAQAATIKALVEALEHCKECAGDTATMPTSVIHAICDAALVAANSDALSHEGGE